VLIIFDRPVDGHSDFAGKRQPSERLPAKPVSEILGIQALIVNQPGEPFNRGFLIALCASQFGLIAGLLFNDRRDEGRNGFNLVAVRPGQQLSDIFFDACRQVATPYLFISCSLSFFHLDQTQTQIQPLRYQLRGMRAGSYQMSVPSVSLILPIAWAVYQT
jgi:hypothetical protein